MRNALNLIIDTFFPDQANRRQERYRSFDWAGLRFQHVAALRARLAETRSSATVNHALSALRGVLRAAYRLGQLSGEDYHRAIDIDGVSGSTLPAGRELDEGELLALVQACVRNSSPGAVRDVALIGTLYAGGLRRAELIALDLADFDQSSGKLIIRSGKGNKARTVYLTSGALAALVQWLAQRGTAAGPIFTRIHKGGHDMGTRLTSQAVYNILKKWAKEAGVRDFSPHDLRRTFVSDMLERGADIATVAKLAGHADVKTTAKYDRRPEESKRKAAGLLHFPFREG
jgi:integrase